MQAIKIVKKLLGGLVAKNYPPISCFIWSDHQQLTAKCYEDDKEIRYMMEMT